jgi:hypothetical protein
MTSGLTAKIYDDQAVYDIHLDNTACGGFSNFKYLKNSNAVLHLFRAYYSVPGSDYYHKWSEDIFNRYSAGHKVIAPMVFVRWGDDGAD